MGAFPQRGKIGPGECVPAAAHGVVPPGLQGHVAAADAAQCMAARRKRDRYVPMVLAGGIAVEGRLVGINAGVGRAGGGRGGSVGGPHGRVGSGHGEGGAGAGSV